MSARYKQLSYFILNEMRMSHIYQPVMLAKLIQNRGEATVRDIAKALQKYDDAQIEYYEKVTKNMVGRVLTKNRGITEKEGNVYRIRDFDQLSSDERKELVSLCMKKLDDYIKKRGDRIWAHRRKSYGYISGTIRHEVLKRAKLRCELCGISDKNKGLDVDHIIPRNHGGTDDLSNLQALCYSCNSMKRDRDATNLREVAGSYLNRKEGCLFCAMTSKRVVRENELCYSIYDGYPVTSHHTLIIPKRHVSDYFELYQPERNAIQSLLEEERAELQKKDGSVSGFNIGVNVGETAGQTIFHCHIHLIPRRDGDVSDPRGGVRGVIPGKQNY